MAQFNFENMVTELTRLDGHIQDGPLMRWQRKTADSGRKSVSRDKGKIDKIDNLLKLDVQIHNLLILKIFLCSMLNQNGYRNFLMEDRY